MGHKHKKEKRKHRSRSRSRSVEKEREREREKERERERDRSKHRHHKRHHKDRKEQKRSREESPTYISSDDDCIVVPPPPKISRQATPPPPPPPAISNTSSDKSSSGAGDSLSIEETNRIRAKLGLKPLQVDDKPTSVEVKADNDYKNSTERAAAEAGLDVINDDLGEFVHKPAENLAKKVKADKIKEKLAERKAKRALEQKLARVKRLGESSSDEEDSAAAWAEKNRKIVNEKQQAEKRAKMLEEMDAEFGIGELVAEEIKTERRNVYGAKDLRGLRVEHDLGSFGEGKQVVLTLKDQGVLEEEGDVLVNVNMVDDEHHKKNIDRRKQKPGYNAYEDEEDMDTLNEPEVKVLSKYDEEIDGAKKKSFTLGVDDSPAAIAQRKQEALTIKNKLMKKKLETLAMPAPKLASEYYNEEEISTKFKKLKKVKKVRKKGILKADDLEASVKEENSTKDMGSRRMRSRIVDDDDDMKAPPPPRISEPDDIIKEEPMDVDDFPALPSDLGTVKIEADEDLALELALKKARKLKQMEAAEEAASGDKVVKMIVSEEYEPAFGETGPGGSIVLNSTAEFCRTLGDIPTYGLAGNRDEDAEELLDFEREMIEEQRRRQEEDVGIRGAWNEVEGDEQPAEVETTETPILDPEPDLGGGMAGALRLAVSKGYLEKEILKRPSASRFAHLQAQNYSIDDKAHVEDDKFGRRERYAGPTSEFKDKDGYKPNVKLDYIDDEGHVLNAKEAFRYLSHKFHGKGPGKNKVEKRMKKMEQDALMKQMSSTDTPLGTLNMLQAKQKETQSPFIVLSGGKHQTTTISKTKLSK
ncbi:U4/U6.U5 tri-snRNP-associated protein 1 [Frankliniella occidentalis]|uniref:U4/U6.U5 tri-snRNP-associated protein 1 n=1 Tax=Frankliniella occidentalis TaxID=133901 RepID=A0A6J1SM92_FRAOC|nr:U4/U6.U5 tri-snRNP-associated protein 1 [Frankliniella occidentalis]